MEVKSEIRSPATLILRKGPSLYIVETSWTPLTVRTLCWVFQSAAYLL